MFKKSVISVVIGSLFLTGCAGMQNPLDNQDATKGVKTLEGAAIGAGVGNILGAVFGVDRTTLTLLGAFIGGFIEYKHETDREVKLAEAKKAELAKAGIEAEVKTVTAKVTDEKGEVHKTQELQSFSVHAYDSGSVQTVASLAKESKFGGKVVAVAPKSEHAAIQQQIAAQTAGKNPAVQIALLTPEQAAKYGAKEGIAWVPAHPETVQA